MPCTTSTSLYCSFFYASSACVYPEFKQLDTTVEGGGLKESDAWPAQVSEHTFKCCIRINASRHVCVCVHWLH